MIGATSVALCLFLSELAADDCRGRGIALLRGSGRGQALLRGSISSSVALSSTMIALLLTCGVRPAVVVLAASVLPPPLHVSSSSSSSSPSLSSCCAPSCDVHDDGCGCSHAGGGGGGGGKPGGCEKHCHGQTGYPGICIIIIAGCIGNMGIAGTDGGGDVAGCECHADGFDLPPPLPVLSALFLAAPPPTPRARVRLLRSGSEPSHSRSRVKPSAKFCWMYLMACRAACSWFSGGPTMLRCLCCPGFLHRVFATLLDMLLISSI